MYILYMLYYMHIIPTRIVSRDRYILLIIIIIIKYRTVTYEIII
jgi:hypothetical protein